MRQIPVNIYKLEELSKDVRHNVIMNWRGNNICYVTDEVVTEFITDNPVLDLDPEDVKYSVEGSQGDGACFDMALTTVPIRDMFLKDKSMDQLKRYINANKIEVTARTRRNAWANSYNHEKTRDIEVDWHIADSVDFVTARECESALAKLDKIITIWYRLKCRKLYQDLEDTYMDWMSTEQMVEDIESTDTEFYADGTVHMVIAGLHV